MNTSLQKQPETSTTLAMYMLWPTGRPAPSEPVVPRGYELCVVESEDMDKARAVIEMDGTLSDAAWSRVRDAVVPDGLFVVREKKFGAWIGSVSAVHNPAATRFYFAGGGELGYLVVAPEHRRRGLGAALIAASVRRLHQGGYRNIFLGVQSWRLPAIRAYLRAGFLPLIHAPSLAPRWRAVFEELGLAARENKWPTGLERQAPGRPG